VHPVRPRFLEIRRFANFRAEGRLEASGSPRFLTPASEAGFSNQRG